MPGNHGIVEHGFYSVYNFFSPAQAFMIGMKYQNIFFLRKNGRSGTDKNRT
jgi:hypothetical protein